MTEATKKKKKANYYIDNKKFYEEMCKFHAERQIDPKYRIPEYIGDCILKIATKMSYSPNFINYSYRDEMIADGIENCITYIHNFKPVLNDPKDINKHTGKAKKSNPFSYFSQYIFNAFLRRIAKEKNLTRLKSKYVQNIGVLDEVFGDNVIVSTQGHDDQGEANRSAADTLKFYYNYDLDTPKKKKEKKAAKEKHNLENF